MLRNATLAGFGKISRAYVFIATYYIVRNYTIFQTPCPLLKYDQIFNTSARWWESVNSQNKEITRWPGHCWEALSLRSC